MSRDSSILSKLPATEMVLVVVLWLIVKLHYGYAPT